MNRLPLITATMLMCGGAAATDLPCAKTEYAKLKDSSKGELIAEVCGAKAKADLNKELMTLTQSERDSSAAGAAYVSCVSQAEDARLMLKKKFKAPEPLCK